MEIKVDIKHGFDQVLEEMGVEKTDDILLLKAKDRFFTGYGCEVPYYAGMPDDLRSNKRYILKSYQSSLGNISLCIDVQNKE
ncbi:MAG: hypothetical protein AB1499_04060 [Nitrospirota bacterium]